MSSGEQADYTRLEAHLWRYTARNTFDYFIHKDLGSFMRRELDFYIKNEVMHLDDVENESAPRVEQYLSKIKVVRRIAGKIIDFLAQLEDFQKKLWLKKKFVVETQYCITLSCIPEQFHPEIAANDAQREEWVNLFAIDEIEGDLTKQGYSIPLKPEFLNAHPTLVVDTRHFDEGFTSRMIETVGDLDEQADGLLVDADNLHALTLFQTRYSRIIDLAFNDPPYNTGSGDFNYKDNYQHSSWLAAMQQVFAPACGLLKADGFLFTTIDNNEVARLRELLDECCGSTNFIGDIIWNHTRQSKHDEPHISRNYNHILAYRRGPSPVGFRRPRTEEDDVNYRNPDNDPRGPWRAGDVRSPHLRPTLRYAIVSPDGHEIQPPDNGWRWSEETVSEKILKGEIVFSEDGSRIIRKIHLADQEGRTPEDLWSGEQYGTTRSATQLLKDLFGASPFDTPKPPELVASAMRLISTPVISILDFFAGSGTTGHAVINLNREDGGRRKFILVEMGDYFDTVLLPRIKKVTFTPEWKDGKPKRLATPEEAKRSPRIVKVIRLESYEDALNNLETRRTDTQQHLLDAAEAQGADGLKEQYLLHYMLDVETRGSQSLLNVQAFTDPTAYKLKVKRPGSDESNEVNVDLLETFNWLIGITVQHIAAPQLFSAAFERDTEKRLCLKSRLKQETDGPYWFRTVTGTTPDGRRTLIIWRKLTGMPEQDNLVLDEWFTKQGYSAKDSEFDLIYVNGGNNLENLKAPDDTWKVRLIEEDFHRLMFEIDGT
jgi:adenine-specific DNA-methyltransferase